MPAHSSLRHPKKTLMKASSFDVLRQLSFEQENAFDCGQSSLPKLDNAPRRPASSGNLIAQSAKCAEHESSLAFQVGNTNNDDVFTDRPVSGAECRVSSSKADERSTEEASNGSEEQALQTDVGNWSLVPRDPLQVDAQNIYPSSACVFVANLTQAFDDRKLEIEVTKYFSQFGTVFVKIRRDSRQMPFAFCQFTCDADAENAGENGNGAVILGRPCRVEKATAHSCFVVYKLSGAQTTREEAINLLSVLGPIDKAYPLGSNSQKTEKFPPAIIVHYKRYDSSRSVAKTFEGHPIFRVDAYDPKAEIRQQHRKSDQQSYAQYEKDRRSAYFGNLPLNMTADVLKSLASQCGKVLCAEIATKEIPQVGGRITKTCFGFVEFVRPDSIDKAIMNYHRKSIDGHIIKVERKRSRMFNGPSYSTSGSQRGLPTGVPSTWHGNKGINGTGAGNRIMNANTFIPPSPGLLETYLPTSAGYEKENMASPPKADGSRPVARTNAGQVTHSTTTSTISNESPTPFVRLPINPEYSSAWNKAEMRQEKLIDTAEVKEEERGPKAIQTTHEPEVCPHDNYQSKSEEHLCEYKNVESMNSATKDDKKALKTPTKPPMKAAAEPSPAYSTEPAAPCFYPIIQPYTYSPYGFHPIQSLMAHPMTPQGGPLAYNSFGQSYYGPTPYSDVFTMYPLMQQYPTSIVETPARPSTLNNCTENPQQDSRNEATDTSPKSGGKINAKGKGKAH
ncbi:hypothetical protein THAR02_06408 [Trichoderma harzianum]|uniref:RRM domain-containing protein n=1 Tax=Trichoderma harzianum TaxID=5544 RepID=A0A0G0A8S8_TRIHA|nr:hypothetical protein THAR02_06408 [Trichoderma harzianum]